MDIKLLAIVGLAIIASIGASRVPYNNEYYTEKPVGKTTLNWVYFWEELNDNPTTVPSDLTAVDCHLAPNIINWIPFSILFDRELNFDFDVLERGDIFMGKARELRNKCPDVKIIIDPSLEWNSNLAGQISREQIPMVVKSLVNFCAKYYIQGLVIGFDKNVVLDDAKTYYFFKELSAAFKYNNLNLLGYFPFETDYSYIRPLVFEFLDEIVIQVLDSTSPNTLSINMPIVGERGYGNIIETFLNMGATADKLSPMVIIFGDSYRRTCSDSSTVYDITKGEPEAAGFGSFLYAEGLITDPKGTQFSANKHTRPQICRIEQDYEWKKDIDPIQQTPYAYTDSVWISYDNKESIKTKLDIAKYYKVGGVVMDAINFDDYLNICGDGKYPMTKHIIDVLGDHYGY